MIEQTKPSKPVWTSNLGSDSYGTHADLEVKGVRQCFRWIKAGEFCMGSPEDEEGRYSNEILYKVRLTHFVIKK